LLFLSTQIDNESRALTEASAARVLLLRLEECIYDVFCECMVPGVSEVSFGALIELDLTEEFVKSNLLNDSIG
jgi:hypothetical protein